MAIYNARIKMRRGLLANLDVSKLEPGEWAIPTDSDTIFICLSQGNVLEMPSKQYLLEHIQEILDRIDEIDEDIKQINAIKESVIEYANICTQQASISTEQATKSQSYAVGGTNTRENEDTDNAKYFYEQAKELTKGTVRGVKGNNETEYRDGLVNLTSENIGAVSTDGDIKDTFVTFESDDAKEVSAYTDFDVMGSKEKTLSLFKKISTMAKNIRYMAKMLGTTDISSIGDGTVTSGISTLNDSLTHIKVTVNPKTKNSTEVLARADEMVKESAYRVEYCRISYDTNTNLSYSLAELRQNGDTISIFVINYQTGLISINARSRGGKWCGWKTATMS